MECLHLRKLAPVRTCLHIHWMSECMCVTCQVCVPRVCDF
jgi:hypothetical protein